MSGPIRRLLVANRGEIACRIMRTARRMGIGTAAVFSAADAGALHVREADAAVPIGPAPARDSYLVADAILAAAGDSGADAIHPGYGFLSENADFAEAVIAAGLIWVGPDPASIRAMGLKDAAKARMIAAGVPVTPGYLGQDQGDARLAAEAAAIGWPVLVKAVAGGGGKGMRRVDQADEFVSALAACRREAAAAFGDDRVLLEKYVTSPRHIEVQIFGDRHGNVVHLFERDCSLQRRHQKVIEEAPAPGMDAGTRAAVCDAAVRAAQAVDYVGAGTIEFIADARSGLSADRIWFMEMNTRLQVEHPVTEAITGVDLVEWQLRVAQGEPLPKRQEELAIDGHAIEARLYAEDPATGFLPSTGRLEAFELAGPVRIDAGVEEGDTISPFYDPMIAKLIGHGATREEARARVRDALGETVAWPVRTNAGFLVRLLDHPAFVRGEMETGLIAREGEALLPPVQPGDDALAAAAAALIGPVRFAGFRLNAGPCATARFLLDDQAVEIALTEVSDEPPVPRVLVSEEGVTWALAPWRADGRLGGDEADGTIRAPMPGRIIAVGAAPGQAVAAGDALVTLEAMKMEHALVAPFAATVAEVMVAAGAQVAENVALVRLERSET